MTENLLSRFQPETVLKRDVFSETISGQLDGAPVVMRSLDHVPIYAGWLARALLRREVRALRAVEGIEGTPQIIYADRTHLLRSWAEGTPLQHAQPNTAEWFADARRLLRVMRRVGVTHNDNAKPQNWLMTPDGRAALIDFQLAAVHPRRGRWHRLQAREDLRHLMKQKRAYAPELLTASQHAMLARKSLPNRIWMATGKRAYNFITRRLMNWSDGEGTEDRLERDGPAIRDALLCHPHIQDVALCTYALPSKGVGLYAFVETDLTDPQIRKLLRSEPELLQPVQTLPRDKDGNLRMDLLELIATNQIDKLPKSTKLQKDIKPIVDNRLNFTDRIIKANA